MEFVHPKLISFCAIDPLKIVRASQASTYYTTPTAGRMHEEITVQNYPSKQGSIKDEMIQPAKTSREDHYLKSYRLFGKIP